MTAILFFAVSASAQTVDSGTCGENLAWTLTDDGTLTISGTGDMTNYGTWPATSVVHDSGVYDEKYIREVVIEEGVTSVGGNAFCTCGSMIENIRIPSTVTNIAGYAFENCNMETIDIPASVNHIGYYAFTSCANLRAINVDPNNNCFASADGVLFDKEMKTLIRCPENKEGNYVIPSTVTYIEPYSFHGCSSLTGITIPDSVTEIGGCAFDSCTALTEITIPNSVKRIGVQAFYRSNITEITIPASVTDIANEAFIHCDRLQSISVDPDNTCYASLNGILYDKNMQNLIFCPHGMTGEYKSIPTSVRTIAEEAFRYYCDGFTDIYYDGTKEQWNNILIEDGNDVLSKVKIHMGASGEILSFNLDEYERPIQVMLNNETLWFDQPPVIENGRTLVPLRAIFEALGADVYWDNETQTVFATRDTTGVSLQIGSNIMFVDDYAVDLITLNIIFGGKTTQEITLDVPAKIINDRTMVPVRAISEAFGCDVDWDDSTKTVSITQDWE